MRPVGNEGGRWTLSKIRAEFRHVIPMLPRASSICRINLQVIEKTGAPNWMTMRTFLCGKFAGVEVQPSAGKREVGRYAINPAENSHLPFPRQERAMFRLRRIRSLQKFAALNSSVHNDFNQERHLTGRTTFKERRAAALAEWRQFCAA